MRLKAFGACAVASTALFAHAAPLTLLDANTTSELSIAHINTLYADKFGDAPPADLETTLNEACNTTAASPDATGTSPASPLLAKRIDVNVFIGDELCRWWAGLMIGLQWVVQLPEDWWVPMWGPNPQFACDKWAESLKGVACFWKHSCRVWDEDLPGRNGGWLRMYFTSCIGPTSETVEEKYKKTWGKLIEDDMLPPYTIKCHKGMEKLLSVPG
jgi:hypothetical protein